MIITHDDLRIAYSAWLHTPRQNPESHRCFHAYTLMYATVTGSHR